MRRTIKTLEDAFSAICENSYPLEWDENHLSFPLMRKLREVFSHRVINFNSWSKIVEWKSFKNRGKQETSYGDIALIVNVQFSSGETLKGVAAIEAKRDFDSGNFDSIDQNQLARILTNVPYSHLLLYTHRKIERPQKFPDESTWKSHIWVSPINTAGQLLKQITKGDTGNVLRTSLPFTMFLTSRIFWGLDLDFRDEVLLDIESGINRIINPAYLGLVNVYYEGQFPIEIAFTDLWEQI